VIESRLLGGATKEGLMQYKLYGLVIAGNHLPGGKNPIAQGEIDVQVSRVSSLKPLPSLSNWCTFRLDITDQEMLIRQFHSLKRLTMQVSVRRLSFPGNFNLLPAVREVICNDLKNLDN